MMRPPVFTALAACAAALVLAALPGCKKAEPPLPYDNTAEREAFFKRFNTETLEKLQGQRKALEAELAGQLDEETRKDKTAALADLTRHLQRPNYFEKLEEKDLPADLKWENGMDQPEMGSPNAKKGGTFHSFIQGFDYPPTLRPFGAEANNSFRNYHWDDMELGLTGLHLNTGAIIPAGADRWAVTDGGQTIYYHIDPEARWSDGKDLTSYDWVMSVYMYLSKYLTENFYRDWYSEQYWGIATYGPDYLCLRLATPKPMGAAYIASFFPSQEDFYKEFGPDFESRYNWRPRPTISGYEIRAEDIRKGRSISMRRVKDWWARDRKYYKYRFNPDVLEFTLVRDENKVFEMFKRGEVDLFYPLDPIKWYERTEIDPVFNGYIEKVTFYDGYPSISYGLYLNEHNTLLANQDIRIGLQHATNWQKVIDFDLRGDSERLNLLQGGYGKYSNPNIKTRPFSVEKAREAFARAGFTTAGPDGILQDSEGRRLSFSLNYTKIPRIEAYMLRLKEEAVKAGVEYKLEGMENTASFSKTQRKEHEIAFLGFQGSLPIPDYYQSLHSKEAYEPGTRKPKAMSNNLFSFADPAVDVILEANRAARTEQELQETSWKLEEIIHDRALWVPGVERPFYRLGSWRWVRWPEDFNVQFANDPEMGKVMWIDNDIKKETEDAMHAIPPRTFPEKNVVYDQYRKKKTAE